MSQIFRNIWNDNGWVGRYQRRPRRKFTAFVHRRPAGPHREPINRRIRRIINQQKERKIRDFTMADAIPVGGTSVITLASGIAEGDSETDRDGETVLIQSIQLKGKITVDTDVTSDTHARLIIFRANRNIDGVLPQITELLEADDVDSLRQNLNRGDYTTLYDKDFIIRVPVTASDDRVTLINVFLKFKVPKEAHYDLTTAVIGACEKGHIFVIRMTDQANTFQPTWDINARLTFKDK